MFTATAAVTQLLIFYNIIHTASLESPVGSTDPDVSVSTPSSTDIVFPTFSSSGLAKQFRPRIQPLKDLIAQVIRKHLYEKQNKTTAGSSSFLFFMDHARLEQSRFGEAKGQLSILKELAKNRGATSGSFRGISYKKVSPSDNSSSAEAAEPKPSPPRSRSLLQKGSFEMRNITLYADCSQKQTQPWVKQKLTYTAHFSLDGLENYTLHSLQSAQLHLQFTGADREEREPETIIFLLSLNKRSKGERRTHIIAYRYLNSTQPSNVTIDVMAQLRRWLRNPAKNKGFSLSLQSSFGVNQNIGYYVDLPPQCTPPTPQPGSQSQRFKSEILDFTPESMTNKSYREDENPLSLNIQTPNNTGSEATDESTTDALGYDYTETSTTPVQNYDNSDPHPISLLVQVAVPLYLRRHEDKLVQDGEYSGDY